ncbi:MAG: NmrA family NAD(P)-binding protein [Fibrella sp.]|nr:NmrA family NAD(P)-binding protein [Armatimonadota bacterium]
MSKPMILVTGATGKTGSAVVSQLLKRGWPVRAVVRTLDARSERLKNEGADVVVADMFDPGQLVNAMRGASRAYYCPPFHAHAVHGATAFATAAREAKLEAIVGLSQWLASPAHPSLLTRQHWLIDRLFSLIPGVTHTIINPGFFADNYLRLTPFAVHFGILPNLTGDSRNAPPSTEDIARVAVACLIDPDRHGGKTYRPTGPALLSVPDMTRILSRVLGRKVVPINMPMPMFVQAARADGVSAFAMSGIRHYFEEHKRGTFEIGAPTGDVYEVTGTPPEDFETIARRYAAMPKSQRNAASTLRAYGDFLRIGMTLPYNLDRFEREQGHPIPPHPEFAVDSEVWRQEHGVQTVEKTAKGADTPLFQGTQGTLS